ncbi:hypothetical protein Acr_24g0008040 [Actinidia rufa]|uniref:Uncharacterized protein n=1 Tax=Actinidia rufa TaxID=165716 RepID=A0A7J0GVS7_9ERIC|nr:hypothetical protein Acr_24g0008040 [Actinidia rufa]
MVICCAGIAVYLTQEVINNAFVDLDPIPCEGGGIPSSVYSKASNGPLLQPCQKKRKHEGTTASFEEYPDRVDLEVGVAKNQTPVSVKIAALEAIETLLTVLATLRALLASLLSPAHFRPANLARGLELFHRGWGWGELQWELVRLRLGSLMGSLGGGGAVQFTKGSVVVAKGITSLGMTLGSVWYTGGQGSCWSGIGPGAWNNQGMRETGTKVAEFCAHALLALEVLIHPRALSPIDFSPSSNTAFDGFNRLPNVYSYGNKQNTPFSSRALGKRPGDSILGGDDLYESWLANDYEIENPVIESGKDKSYPNEKPSETLISDPPSDKITPVADSSFARVLEESRATVISTSAGERVVGKGYVVTVEVQEVLEPIKQAETMAAVGDGPVVTQQVVSDGGAPDSVEVEPPTSKNFLAAMAGSSVARDASTTVASDLESSKPFAMDLERESSVDSLPDIVDGDPDSD